MAYPSGATVSYNNCPCLYLQTVIDPISQEKEYTKNEAGVISILKSQDNISASPIKDGVDITNNDGRTQDTSHPGRFDFVYYTQDCSTSEPATLGACDVVSSGTTYRSKTTKQFDLTQTYTFSVEINTQEAIDKCYSRDAIRAEIFAARKFSILQGLESKVLDTIAPTLGGYSSQTSPTNSINTPHVLNFLNPGTISSPNLATGLQVGRQEFRKKNKNTQIAWLAQDIGLVEMELEKNPNADVTLSDSLNDAMVDIVGVTNVEYLWGIPKGTYLLKTWNRYVGNYAVPMNTRGLTEKMTMDLWGFTWDVTYTRELCKDIWHFQLNFGVVKVPDISCGNRDALNFLVGCGVTSCTDLQTLFATQTSFSGGVGA